MKSDVNMLYLSIAIAVICGILLLLGTKRCMSEISIKL